MTNHVVNTANASRHGFFLSENDTLRVGEEGSVTIRFSRLGPSSKFAVKATDSSIIVNDGLIKGPSVGVGMQDAAILSVGKTGLVLGDFAGVTMEGNAPTVVNAGTIIAQHSSPAQQSTPVQGAILVGNALSVKIINTGTIKAGSGVDVAIGSLRSSADTITNKGQIIGKVELGGGSDTFDTSKGKVKGLVDGGAGSDKLIGGAVVDKFAGGADSDTFVFKTKPNQSAVDHITDFRHGQDKIALSKSLFKLDPGEKMSDAFHDITGGLKLEQADDRILYNHKNGFLFYDADGKGGKAPVHFATLDNHAILTSSDFLLV